MASRRGEAHAQCKVCRHPERTRIELLALGGASNRAVAKKFGLTHHSVGRHMLKHLSDERRAALALGPVTREALASRVGEESESLLDHYKATRSALYAMLDACITAGDAGTAALVTGRLHENFAAMARLTGQLAQSPLVQHNVQNNYFLSDPGFRDFQLKLIAALRPFAEARRAVIAEFEALEATPAATVTPKRSAVTIEALPPITQEAQTDAN